MAKQTHSGSVDSEDGSVSAYLTSSDDIFIIARSSISPPMLGVSLNIKQANALVHLLNALVATLESQAELKAPEATRERRAG